MTNVLNNTFIVRYDEALRSILIIQQAYYIHADHLNTPRLIENQSQQVVWRWDNDDPFGANMANENPSGLGAFEFNLRLPGQYFDRETNNHYNYYRDYSPEIGRYIQSDPIGLRGGRNTYAFVNLNPLGAIDPLGLASVYRGPNNNYSGTPLSGPECTKAIWISGYIVGWEPCNPTIGITAPT